MLDIDTTNQYIRQAKSGNEQAKEKLLQENSNLMKSIVRRYLGKGVEFDDLYQLAGIGLLKAINGFNEEFGVRFSTYAVPMIAGEIKRFMRDDGSIKVSRTIKMSAKAIYQFIEEFGNQQNRQPTLKELSDHFNMPESEIVFTMGSIHMPVSLYEKGDYKDEQSQELLERIAGEDNQDEMIDNLLLKTAIEELPERERKIIILRYFRDMTQSEVAKMIGVSQVQVSRLENKVIEGLRDSLAE